MWEAFANYSPQNFSHQINVRPPSSSLLLFPPLPGQDDTAIWYQ